MASMNLVLWLNSHSTVLTIIIIGFFQVVICSSLIVHSTCYVCHHLEQLKDVMRSISYGITDTDPIPPKMADTSVSVHPQ